VEGVLVVHVAWLEVMDGGWSTLGAEVEKSRGQQGSAPRLGAATSVLTTCLSHHHLVDLHQRRHGAYIASKIIPFISFIEWTRPVRSTALPTAHIHRYTYIARQLQNLRRTHRNKILI
jgi:hypothetical protein